MDNKIITISTIEEYIKAKKDGYTQIMCSGGLELRYHLQEGIENYNKKYETKKQGFEKD